MTTNNQQQPPQKPQIKQQSEQSNKSSDQLQEIGKNIADVVIRLFLKRNRDSKSVPSESPQTSWVSRAERYAKLINPLLYSLGLYYIYKDAKEEALKKAYMRNFYY